IGWITAPFGPNKPNKRRRLSGLSPNFPGEKGCSPGFLGVGVRPLPFRSLFQVKRRLTIGKHLPKVTNFLHFSLTPHSHVPYDFGQVVGPKVVQPSAAVFSLPQKLNLRERGRKCLQCPRTEVRPR